MLRLAENVWKLNVDSNIYLLKLKENIIIDTGPKAYSQQVKEQLGRIIDIDKIQKIILTHIHYDHAGNVDLFPGAEIYASEKEILDFRKNPLVAFNLSPKSIMLLRKRLKMIESIRASLNKMDIRIIDVPGHTAGSIAVLYKKILFSGDCLFENGIGRYDLPNSVPAEMESSLARLRNLEYDILAPGHDY